MDPEPTFEELFRANTERLADKWEHYFRIYDRHFARFRGKSPKILEIGVSNGGSKDIWQKFFGPGVQYVGVDVDERCKQFEDPDSVILIGDQASRPFIRAVGKMHGPFDIVIDDGGHSMDQQKHSFEELYGFVKPDGVYLVEDTHTSYWGDWGGGLNRKGTFIEYCKTRVDDLNAGHIDLGRATTTFTETTDSITFYDSIVVFEKGPHPVAVRTTSGQRIFT